MSDGKFDHFTEDELRRIEAKWKSDIEIKVDALIAFAEEYKGFLRILIEREKSRADMRKAIIEKTLTGLILSGFVTVGALIWSGMKTEFQDFIRLFTTK